MDFNKLRKSDFTGRGVALNILELSLQTNLASDSEICLPLLAEDMNTMPSCGSF